MTTETAETAEEAWRRGAETIRAQMRDHLIEEMDDILTLDEIDDFPIPPYMPINPPVVSDA